MVRVIWLRAIGRHGRFEHCELAHNFRIKSERPIQIRISKLRRCLVFTHWLTKPWLDWAARMEYWHCFWRGRWQCQSWQLHAWPTSLHQDRAPVIRSHKQKYTNTKTAISPTPFSSASSWQNTDVQTGKTSNLQKCALLQCAVVANSRVIQTARYIVNSQYFVVSQHHNTLWPERYWYRHCR